LGRKRPSGQKYTRYKTVFSWDPDEESKARGHPKTKKIGH